MEFRPYQKDVIRHILKTPRCAVWAGMGTGKTSSVLFALEWMKKKGAGKALVLAPLRVASMTWPDEAEKWGFDLRVANVTGKDKKRELSKDADIYCTNYENLPWLINQLGDFWPFETIVTDESTRLKGFRVGGKSVRARLLAKRAFRSKRFIELTGTPSPNGLIDLWGQFYFLDKGKRLGRSFSAFTHLFFDKIQMGADAFAVKYEPRKDAQEKIQEAIKDICISINAADYFPLEEPIVSNVYVELPAKARAAYEDITREMLYELENGAEITAINAAGKTVKWLQIASGAIYDADGNWHLMHDEKIKALQSIVEEAAGMPVLVAYHWRADLERLKKAFPQGRELDKNPQTLKQWNAGEIPLLFAHPASAGHGLNLQDGGNILVFFSHWWNLEQYQQIVERIGPTRQAQAGHKRPVFIYHIIAKNTADEMAIKRRESKREVQDLLLDTISALRRPRGACYP